MVNVLVLFRGFFIFMLICLVFCIFLMGKKKLIFWKTYEKGRRTNIAITVAHAISKAMNNTVYFNFLKTVR